MEKLVRWGCLGAVAATLALTVLAVILGHRNKVLFPPETLVRYMGADPQTLNSIVASDSYESEVNRFIMDTLIGRDFKDPDVYVPRLAESWEVSDDHLVYTFRLRMGVRWHDGEPFTADDVIYSFNLIMDPKVDAPHLRNYYQDVEKVEAPDDYTVVFTMTKPYFLALDFNGGLPIVARHIFDDGTDFNTHEKSSHPIGTGEYRFVEWRRGEKIVMERNEDFWGEPPNFERIIIRIISNDHAALALFKKQELDMVGLSAFHWEHGVDSERFNEIAEKIAYDRTAYSYIGWNSRLPFFEDKRVRRAMTHLVNRPKILEEIYYGLGTIVTGPFFYQSPIYDSSIEPWPFDPGEARRLLGEAGWVDSTGDGVRDKDGVRLQFDFLLTEGSDTGDKVVRILQEDFARAGVVMNIRRLEWGSFLNFLNERQFGACFLGWSLGWESDPYQLWHSSLADMPGSSNMVGFANAEADEIIEKGRVTFDVAERQAMYRRFHAILHEEQPYTFMFTPKALMAVNRRIGNVNTYPIRPGYDIREWTYEGMVPRLEAAP